jgi:hypothetical protein
MSLYSLLIPHLLSSTAGSLGFDCHSGQTFLLVAVFSIGGVILTDFVSRMLLVGK